MEVERQFDYDYFVVGGGSGGMASAKAAAALGAKVAIADFVKPSTQGTTWGLGGTCVNVGCIPKKLMHFASILGELREEQKELGLRESDDEPHNWQEMLEKVNGHVRSLNWGYKTSLADKEIKYFNALASIKEPHTVVLTFKNKPTQTVTAKHILLAAGGRPTLLDLPGAKECCITSDDIFWREGSPGKTLVVGVGYIGMECGGFLRGMGYQVDILHRGAVLRGFDPEMVANIVEFMKDVVKVNFVQGSPVSFEKMDKKVKATWKNDKGETLSGEYDTVLMAVGRFPDVKSLGLDQLNIKLDNWGKIVVDGHYQSTVEGVYAIGDIVSEGRELTPVAIRQGKILANGLFKDQWGSLDLKAVATTVFTPLEYGCSGFYEEEAIKTFGKDNVKVYSTHFKPFEWQLSHKKKDFQCILKIITVGEEGKIIGTHYTGPNAGEVSQGLSLSVRVGVKLMDLQETAPLDDTLGGLLNNLRIKTLN